MQVALGVQIRKQKEYHNILTRFGGMHSDVYFDSEIRASGPLRVQVPQEVGFHQLGGWCAV